LAITARLNDTNLVHIMAESPTPFAEIDLGPSKLDQFLDAHQKKLIATAILLAIGIIVYVVYSGIAKGNAEDAGAALLKAEKIEDYQAVIKEWPNSKAASTALLLIADVQADKTPEEAIKTLKEFINTNPKHPVIATAKVNLALLLVDQGKADEAVPLLTEVADSETDSYISPLACISLGDISKAAGKKDEAKTWYEKAKEESSERGNTFTDAAQARLALVNALPPKKIKPTPPAPAAPPAAKPTGATTESTPLTKIKPNPQTPVAPPAAKTTETATESTPLIKTKPSTPKEKASTPQQEKTPDAAQETP